MRLAMYVCTVVNYQLFVTDQLFRFTDRVTIKVTEATVMTEHRSLAKKHITASHS